LEKCLGNEKNDWEKKDWKKDLILESEGILNSELNGEKT